MPSVFRNRNFCSVLGNNCPAEMSWVSFLVFATKPMTVGVSDIWHVTHHMWHVKHDMRHRTGPRTARKSMSVLAPYSEQPDDLNHF